MSSTRFHRRSGDGSLALGATKAETVRRVILPAALPGIASAILLGISRAVGETMIVVMAAGQGAKLTANPLEAVTTVTVQIVALITGDTEAETAAGPAFALGFTLFVVTLALNVVALRTVRRFREVLRVRPMAVEQRTPHQSATARRGLARRHRSEWWLAFWGRAALLVSAAALLALVWSVTSRAIFALTESYILVDFDLAGYEADRAESWLRSTLRENIPEGGGRRERRQLYRLVSDGAAFELPDQVEAIPAGRDPAVRLPVLASDHVDLYLKGQLARLQRSDGTFPVLLEAAEESYRLTSVQLGGFESGLQPFRKRLEEIAVRRDEAAARQRAATASLEAEIAASPDAENRDEIEAAIRGYREKGEVLAEEARALRARASASDFAIEADPDFPSVLVRLAGGILKAEQLDRDSMVLSAVRTPMRDGEFAVGDWELLVNPTPEGWRAMSDLQIGWIEWLDAEGRIETRFNWRFFSSGNSREAELAGILGAVTGSAWMMLVTLLLVCPTGVFAALYLEEFAPKNRLTDFIEVNINNLAAVPSILFGLLGLAAFIQFFGLPRSIPLVGGMVLALMTLPTVIIASRASIRAVPGSIRDAALGVGASEVQTVFHHVLPLALPGILTGTIIGMARALGETAPLLLIGMVAFIVGTSGGVLEPASALPVQIFQWSDFPEVAFANKAALATLTLILFLIAMNALAVFLRHRFERRW